MSNTTIPATFNAKDADHQEVARKAMQQIQRIMDNSSMETWSALLNSVADVVEEAKRNAGLG